LNSEWENTLSTASLLLEQGSIDDAKKLLKKFDAYSYCKKISDMLLNDYVHFKRFKNAYENRDYAMIYHMVGKYESFQYSAYYKVVERLWQKNISSIVHQLSNGQVSRTIILELLQPFAGIPEKIPMMQLILKQPDILLKFKGALEKRNFSSFFALADKFPALKSSKEYTTADNMAQKIIKNSQKAIDNEDIDKAEQLLGVLVQFPTKRDEYAELRNALQLLETLYILAETRNYDYFFELAEKHQFLKNTLKYANNLKYKPNTTSSQEAISK